MLAAGITTYGTEAAAHILFDPGLLSEAVKQAPKNWQRMNFQAVVRCSIVGMTIGPPQLVATHFW
jgi:hypothetical protein